MTNLQALILGIVQGLTEYLPVSSSAHLVLLPPLFGWQINHDKAFIFDILVQLGTLVGVIVYFFVPLKNIGLAFLKHFFKSSRFSNQQSFLAWLVFFATLPAAFLGLIFKDILKAYFSSPLAAGYCLVITAALLYLAEKINHKKYTSINLKKSIIIGFAQAFALLPGISRSGSTISAAMFCGLTRKDAAQFSFFMSIPVMLGAALVAFGDLIKNQELIKHMLTPILIGFIAAAISGYLVIKWFMKFISNKPLSIFAYYCLILGLVSVVYFS